MNDAQIRSKLKNKVIGKFSIGEGLYFRVTNEGSGFFVLRYVFNGKRREMTLDRYGRPPLGISLADAKIKAIQNKAKLKEGIDPIEDKKRSKLQLVNLTDDVAEDWLLECKKRLQNPHIPERVYKSDIAPSIGQLPVSKVNSRDVLDIIRKINKSGRPTISNDALVYCKQIFNHAIKLGLRETNPVIAFNNKDAGGAEKSRNRALSFDEVIRVLEILRDNSDKFTRDNYIAFILLLCLGVRKGELIASVWNEFDFEKKIWTLPANRTKTQTDIRIPLPEKLIPFFEELKVRSCGSEYLFPNRRASRRRGYISDDTLNHALAKLFGKDGYKKDLELPNVFEEAGIDHFVVHDLRRTCRSLLAELGTPPHIAERCLNHKIRGVEGIYDRYDYFDDRKDALDRLATNVIKTPASKRASSQ